MFILKSYAGVGSRETPAPILRLMRQMAASLAEQGWMLRTGGAPGADSAFESGVKPEQMELYLPWPGFNGKRSAFLRPTEEAVRMGLRYHPLLAKFDPASEVLLTDRKLRTLTQLMGRNVHQVLGADCRSPSKFLVCWTKDGADGTTILTSSKTGGTGQAIRIAADHKVPVFNLQHPQAVERVHAMLSGAGKGR